MSRTVRFAEVEKLTTNSLDVQIRSSKNSNGFLKDQPWPSSNKQRIRHSVINRMRSFRPEVIREKPGVFRTLYLVFCGSVFAGVSLVLVCLVPIVAVFFGVFYRNCCPKYPRMSSYLMAFGGTVLIRAALGFFLRWRRERRKRQRRHLASNSNFEIESQSKTAVKIECLLRAIKASFTLIAIGVFIAICSDVYRHPWPEMDAVLSDSYCQKTLFLFAFWLANGVFIFAAAVFAVACSVAVWRLVRDTCICERFVYDI